MNSMIKKRLIHLIGYASGLAGVTPECGEGPLVLKDSQRLKAEQGFQWEEVFKPELHSPSLKEALRELNHKLALKTEALVREKKFFIVAGGDHSSAIGTWSGVHHAVKEQGSIGLIWIDAHMDSHVPETSITGRYHGMPLATLLGEGDSALTQLLSASPKIKPEQLCLIGVRSYEAEEAELLKRLKVRVYFMEEVKERGLAVIFKEALQLVNQGAMGYGISLDIDSVDPKEAPGVDVPEPEGLNLNELAAVLESVAGDPRLLGAEVVEFNPSKDQDQRTEKAVVQLIAAMTGHA